MPVLCWCESKESLALAGDFFTGYIPFMYELCRDERLKRLGYRKVVIKNYIMAWLGW